MPCVIFFIVYGYKKSGTRFLFKYFTIFARVSFLRKKLFMLLRPNKKKSRCVSGSPTDPSLNPPTLTFFFAFLEQKYRFWKRKHNLQNIYVIKFTNSNFLLSLSSTLFVFMWICSVFLQSVLSIHVIFGFYNFFTTLNAWKLSRKKKVLPTDRPYFFGKGARNTTIFFVWHNVNTHWDFETVMRGNTFQERTT